MAREAGWEGGGGAVGDLVRYDFFAVGVLRGVGGVASVVAEDGVVGVGVCGEVCGGKGERGREGGGKEGES